MVAGSSLHRPLARPRGNLPLRYEILNPGSQTSESRTASLTDSNRPETFRPGSIASPLYTIRLSTQVILELTEVRKISDEISDEVRLRRARENPKITPQELETLNTLRETRRSMGFSREELALRAGIGTMTMCRSESLEIKPRVDTIEKIANALGINIVRMDTNRRDSETRSRPGFLIYGGS